MILTQTTALFVDAYRELNAKKLFWITLVLSCLVPLAIGALGINEKGITLLHWQFDTKMVNTANLTAPQFYQFFYLMFAIPIWLTWAATILALVSTSGIFPSMMTGGTIETMLSKPISRVRLFLTKYLTGLLFAVLQVAGFIAVTFLVIGIRGGEWIFTLWLAVPIVGVFFSYLFAISVLLGVLTRSTIAALLLTIVLWFGLFIVNVADNNVLQAAVSSDFEARDAQEELTAQLDRADRTVKRMWESGQTVVDREGNVIPPNTEYDPKDIAPFYPQAEERAAETAASAASWQKWSDRVVLVKTVLPKTSETIGLLDRTLLADDELNKILSVFGFVPPGEAGEMQAVMEAARNRSIWWVLGSSLVFEAVVLAIACFFFVRRDF